MDPGFDTIASFDVENIDEGRCVRVGNRASHLLRDTAIMPAVRNKKNGMS
jgi:hypothetical protein